MRAQLNRSIVTFLVIAITSGFAAAAQDATESFHGTWQGDALFPQGGHALRFTLEIDQTDPDETRGDFRCQVAGFRLEGSGLTGLDGAERITLAAIDDGMPFDLVLSRAGDTLIGHTTIPTREIILRARRISDDATVPPLVVVDLDQSRPHVVHHSTLPDELNAQIHELITADMTDRNIIGLSVGIVMDGEVADTRSYGWEDFGDGIAASDETMYRWASVSKPLTAIALMQLEEDGLIDLDTDIREYLPEFPPKPWPITARQLLSHQAGIVHYHTGRIVQSIGEYDTECPFESSITAMDMFKHSPLLFEPGAQYSYTTPGYVILGALVEKIGGTLFHEQVKERISTPLGMNTMTPDFPSLDIPHRTHGYMRLRDGSGVEGRVVDSGDSDVSWKLAAGGWTCTIGDFARFAAGVVNEALVEPETWEQIATPQKLTNGAAVPTGLGFRIAQIDGRRALAHSGSQRKCQSFLLCLPDDDVAVVVMSNTEGQRVQGLAQRIAEMVLEAAVTVD